MTNIYEVHIDNMPNVDELTNTITDDNMDDMSINVDSINNDNQENIDSSKNR